MQPEPITPEKEDQYRRLTALFKQYEGHVFNPFERVLIYFRGRGWGDEFTIVPHTVWYFDTDNNKHVMYDPIVRFTASSIIPLEGNEEFIGFHGTNTESRKYKSAER